MSKSEEKRLAVQRRADPKADVEAVRMVLGWSAHRASCSLGIDTGCNCGLFRAHDALARLEQALTEKEPSNG